MWFIWLFILAFIFILWRYGAFVNFYKKDYSVSKKWNLFCLKCLYSVFKSADSLARYERGGGDHFPLESEGIAHNQTPSAYAI